MLIITDQRKIGEIFDHPVYQVTKTSMVELANSKSRSSFLNSRDENRFVHSVYYQGWKMFFFSLH